MRVSLFIFLYFGDVSDCFVFRFTLLTMGWPFDTWWMANTKNTKRILEKLTTAR